MIIILSYCSFASFTKVEDWESDPAEVDLYDRDEVDWDGQYSSGRKRRSDREGVIVDVDSFTRRLRKPRMETQDEINQRMRSVELAVKEALLARGEVNFTDQEFPPSERSLFVDPDNPPSKLQVTCLLNIAPWHFLPSLCDVLYLNWATGGC